MNESLIIKPKPEGQLEDDAYLVKFSDDGKRLLIDVPANHGNSGGPLFAELIEVGTKEGAKGGIIIAVIDARKEVLAYGLLERLKLLTRELHVKHNLFHAKRGIVQVGADFLKDFKGGRA